MSAKEMELDEKELGIREDVEEALRDAAEAFAFYRDQSLAFRSGIIRSIRRELGEHNEELARLAVEETGLGRVEDKIAKNRLVLDKTPGTEERRYQETSAILGDYGLTIKTGAPFGIVGSITPSTNPAATVINNSITMLSAGNVVVFNTHPGAKRVSNRAAMLVNKAVKAAGAPGPLVFSVKNPTIESSQKLMAHPQTRLLVVTGGPDVVRAAMGSGKKVIAAGPGNPPVIVDETAELAEAGKNIVVGASFDNNILCIAEKEVFVVDSVADGLKKEMARHGAIELSPEQLGKITALVFVERNGGKAVNKKYVGKNAAVIAGDAGIEVPKDTRLLFAETPADHPLVVHEQLMPVLPVVRTKDWREAMELAVEAEHGFRHTSAMHSTNIERVMIVSKLVNTTIFVENGPSLSGLGYEGEGHTTMTIAGPTGEGITGPWSFMRQRRFVVDDCFRGNLGFFPHG